MLNKLKSVMMFNTYKNIDLKILKILTELKKKDLFYDLLEISINLYRFK